MLTKNTIFLGLFLVFQTACASSSTGLTTLGDSGGSGGASIASSTDASGTGGGSVISLGAGGSTGGGSAGTSTSYAQSIDPSFDPSVLAIDAGSATDADDPPSTGIVIFDRSGSMASNWTTSDSDHPDAGETLSKWVAASRALIGSLTPVEDRVTIGAILFPSDDSCGVADFNDAVQFTFMPAREFIQNYIARSAYNQPTGSTPLTAAFEAADRAVQTARDEGRLQSRFFVMLLTDGEPNCDSEMSRVLSLTSGWLAQGIQTYVFGLPGSESAHEILDSISQAGGTQTVLIPGTSAGGDQLQSGMAAVY